MTRLGDLMHFGQIFKPCGNHYFAQIAYIFIQFCKGFKNIHFSSEIIFGNFYTHLSTFYCWSHWQQNEVKMKLAAKSVFPGMASTSFLRATMKFDYGQIKKKKVNKISRSKIGGRTFRGSKSE